MLRVWPTTSNINGIQLHLQNGVDHGGPINNRDFTNFTSQKQGFMVGMAMVFIYKLELRGVV